jgi:hypothetical protein
LRCKLIKPTDSTIFAAGQFLASLHRNNSYTLQCISYLSYVYAAGEESCEPEGEPVRMHKETREEKAARAACDEEPSLLAPKKKKKRRRKKRKGPKKDSLESLGAPSSVPPVYLEDSEPDESSSGEEERAQEVSGSDGTHQLREAINLVLDSIMDSCRSIVDIDSEIDADTKKLSTSFDYRTCAQTLRDQLMRTGILVRARSTTVLTRTDHVLSLVWHFPVCTALLELGKSVPEVLEATARHEPRAMLTEMNVKQLAVFSLTLITTLEFVQQLESKCLKAHIEWLTIMKDNFGMNTSARKREQEEKLRKLKG